MMYHKKMKISAALVILAICLSCSQGNITGTTVEVLPISSQGTDFIKDGEPINFIGAFTFPTLTHILYEENRENWQEEIDDYLSSLKEVGISVIRLFGFGPYEIDISGSDTPNWTRLDYLLSQCEQEGIYVIFVLWDYWDYAGGQASDNNDPNEIYAYWDDERILPAINDIVTRYKDRDIIFGWELINEGDAETIFEYYDEVFAWVSEAAVVVKSIDSNHLVSTGFTNEAFSEAYFGKIFPDDPEMYETLYNRSTAIHNIKDIDYMTFHSYGGNIDNMTDGSWYDEDWFQQMSWYISKTVTIQNDVGKPMIHEEWGVQRQVGDETRLDVYSYMLAFFEENGINNIFNGWGDETEPESMMIYLNDDAIVSQIRETLGRYNF